MADLYGDRWRIESSLGEGGQAHTFLVSDEEKPGDELFVLKRLKNLERKERFRREIETILELSHPNIVELFDFDLDAEKPFLVTEYCKGGSLATSPPFWLDDPEIAFRLFLEICDGLSYAHSNNVVHRDIKPENIFLRDEDGPAVIGDFGICYIEESGKRITITEEAVGPRLFIAPELEDGRLKDISARSDVYSLGKILYWLLSGGQVFSREKHRESRWDLKGRNEDSLLGWNDIYLEHANRLLDMMITDDPSQRRSVSNISILARRAQNLIRQRMIPVDPSIPKPCQFCGQGTYQLVAKENIDVRNFGINTVGSPDWRILACNECGHVQVFRIDKASRKDWW